MTLTELFSYLGAPLANNRWSWGAVRKTDGAVFLRVWQDEWRTVDGRRAVRITDNQFFADTPDNLGYSERLRHIDLIRMGNRSFMIMCLAHDVNANPRTIQSFNDREVFVGAAVFEHDGESWLEVVGREPIANVRP